MKKTAKFLFATFLLFGFFLIFVSPVRADIAPPPAPHGSDISPETAKTHVRMVAETVSIEALPNADNETPVANVSAEFHMLNMGENEESMTVRFPLNLVYQNCQILSQHQTLQNFQASVNEQPVPVTIDQELPSNAVPWNGKRDCWANFSATFPVGKEVQIRVSYIQEASQSNPEVEGFVTFPYTLITGSGWYGTIGSADITFSAPWQLENENLIEWRPPNNGRVIGNEIRWHFTDFEPEEDLGYIKVTIVNPAIWRELLRGRRDVVANPMDGEAWGHVGKALKAMTLERRGVYREDYYRESFKAYQKAVEIKPWDADWHYGFAELICSQVGWPMLGDPLTDDFERDCFNQLKAALKINPKHKETLQYLLHINNVMNCPECISKYGLEIYINPVLTEVGATQTQSSIEFSTWVVTYYPTDTPTPSSTYQPSNTPLPDSPAQTSTLTLTPVPQATVQLAILSSPTPAQKSSGDSGLCGSILIPLIAIGAFVLQRMKLLSK